MIIGIVGSGAIVKTIVKVWSSFDDIKVGALWCRAEDEAVGRQLAQENDIARVYTDYDQFLADPSFDVAYIGLVNSLHYYYSLRALEAGKSVVCEKPFTSTGAQARKLLEVAQEKQLFVFESVLPWARENYYEIKRQLPEVGNIKMLRVNISQYSSRYGKYLEGVVLPAFDPQLDGGALYDMGVYSVHWVMGLVGRPKKVVYYPNKGFNGIDTSGALVMDYGTFEAVCTTAKDSTSPSECVVQGDKGYIRIPADPATAKDVTLVRNGQEAQVIDVASLGESFSDIWRRILPIYEQGDRKACYAFMEKVIEVMEVMEEARKSAGIRFSCD